MVSQNKIKLLALKFEQASHLIFSESLSEMLFSFTLLFTFTITILLTGCLKGAESGSGSAANSTTNLAFAGAKNALNLNGTSIQINWDASPNTSTSEYQIYEVTTDGSLNSIGIVDSNTLQYVHLGLTAGTLHSYIVRAKSSDGSTDSNKQSVTALAYAGVSSSTVIDATSASLQYPTATLAIQFHIYCATNNSGNFTLFTSANSSSTSTTLNNLTTGLLYNCKVKAVLPSGTEDENPLITNFTPQTVTNNSPFGFNGISSVTNSDGTSLAVTWSAATPATGITIASYRIYVTDPNDTLLLFTASASATSYTVTGLNAGNNYNVMVRALDGSSQIDGNQKMLTAFTYAGITSAAASSNTTAILYFPSAPSASSFNVYCSTATTNSTYSIASSLNSKTLTGLLPNTLYTCKVNAIGQAGEDANTATATFTTPL